jgi:phosphoribosyl 1,2-cyclic phosphodiesterase
MIVRSLGSGSSGNALVVETARTTLLVDCGLSAATLARGLKLGGRGFEALSAVVVSHEHVDHVRGLQRLLKVGVPLVATQGTQRALDVGRAAFLPIRHGETVELDLGVRVLALGVSHDAAEPCGFCIDGDGVRLTVITDLGTADSHLCEWIATSDLIVLEANHDERLLRSGPYPAHLKRRVLSATGHLSNVDCGLLLRRALAAADGAKTIWLAHLSAVNNRPDLAVATVATALAESGNAAFDIRALPRQGAPVVWRSDAPLGSPAQPQQLALF